MTHGRQHFLNLLCALLTAVLPATSPAAEAPAEVDFARDIRPILAQSCYECHGPKKAKGSLRLDARQSALEGGTTGKMIVPGDPAKSLLLQRVKGIGDDDRMPLKKDPLTDAQIALIARWIEQGADWPDAAAGDVAGGATHWSFTPIRRPTEPAVRDAGWCRNPIDRFILARLEDEKVRPAAEASKETLLRRVSLDLTGLPPSPREIDAFLADSSADAYEKVVDRLLASPHYGERWARHWLDGARYADSNGYSYDNPRSIWPYRDWVIGALNRDMPFDQFTIEQLAGDLLPNATDDQKIATGFHRNTQINEEGGIDPEQFRCEANIDRVNTTGTVFLGLTIGCAQCHNHKFDPISQRDYYSMLAFFNSSTGPTMKLPKLTDPQHAQETKQRIDELEKQLEEDKGNAEKKKALAQLKKEKDGVTTLVMGEQPQPRETFIFIKGDFTRPGEQVNPDTPKVLPPLKAADAKRPTRLDLARWIVNPENPLTSRVQVNRAWQHYFGKGLVDTDNDFGTQGSKPTHPELLDWLATEYVRDGWSTKSLHRLIVTSATYQQSSLLRPELANVDPYNKLLARQSRQRLDAEIVRDVELAASGLLSDKLGGPPVYPPQPAGVNSTGQIERIWTASKGLDRYRRAIYTWVWRLSPHPLLTNFDFADATLTCTRRTRSNTPLQALTLLNDTGFIEFARGLAGRVIREESSDESRATLAFRLCTGREPSADEVHVLLDVLQKQRTAFAAERDQAKLLVADAVPAGVDVTEFAAWTIVSRVVLNLDETITRE